MGSGIKVQAICTRLGADDLRNLGALWLLNEPQCWNPAGPSSWQALLKTAYFSPKSTPSDFNLVLEIGQGESTIETGNHHKSRLSSPELSDIFQSIVVPPLAHIAPKLASSLCICLCMGTDRSTRVRSPLRSAIFLVLLCRHFKYFPTYYIPTPDSYLISFFYNP